MNKMRMRFLGPLMGALVFSLALTGAAMANDVTIMGQVNDQYQVVGANGQVYEIAENDVGDDLTLNYIGVKVMVTGTLAQMEGDEAQVMVVKSFKVIQDKTDDQQGNGAKQETGAPQ